MTFDDDFLSLVEGSGLEHAGIIYVQQASIIYVQQAGRDIGGVVKAIETPEGRSGRLLSGPC